MLVISPGVIIISSKSATNNFSVFEGRLLKCVIIYQPHIQEITML